MKRASSGQRKGAATCICITVSHRVGGCASWSIEAQEAAVSERRTVRTLGVAKPGEPAFFTYEEDPPHEGQFRVDTLYTGLSAGTELTFLKGTNPYLHASWDAERGVFCEGEPSQSYPVRVMGYMEVARVVEARTPVVETGDFVSFNYVHRTVHVIDPEASVVTVLPDSLDPIWAT